MAIFASILKITIRRYFYYHKRGDKTLNKYSDEGHNLSASCMVIIKCTYNIYNITYTYGKSNFTEDYPLPCLSP